MPGALGPPNAPALPDAHFVKMYPAHSITLNQRPIQIPEQAIKLQRLLAARRAERTELAYDGDDACIFAADDAPKPAPAPADRVKGKGKGKQRPAGLGAGRSMGRPTELSHAAAADGRVVRGDDGAAARAARDAQGAGARNAPRGRRLVPPAQPHGRQPLPAELPYVPAPALAPARVRSVAKDLKAKCVRRPLCARLMASRGVNSLLFEVHFPPTFPHSPPFFRIIKPRFLPFVQVSSRLAHCRMCAH